MFITTYEKTELIRILTNKITQLDHKQRTATEQPLKRVLPLIYLVKITKSFLFIFKN
ncbi:hypothetical protein AAUPMB_10335 [Pasteurella multocida subsp. multocida str. Anand1_buffalo]|nr:hypothetical protein AAUPMB_10335 [Pasteurella multocida subsp. multocida str. Anand1_buffalo]